MINNKQVIDYYNKMAKNIKNQGETRNKAKDFSKYDISFMKKFSNPNKTLLDLGSGTGLLINHLIPNFKEIIAVEKYAEFSKFIIESPNLKVINIDLMKFKTNRTFDYVSLFGVMNYFNQDEAVNIYKKILILLKEDGKLIIKNQMGISNDVIINGFSKELQANYYSEYRHIDKEIQLLKDIGFINIEVIDIYPKEFNRWENTHFYALVCEK